MPSRVRDLWKTKLVEKHIASEVNTPICIQLITAGSQQ